MLQAQEPTLKIQNANKGPLMHFLNHRKFITPPPPPRETRKSSQERKEKQKRHRANVKKKEIWKNQNIRKENSKKINNNNNYKTKLKEKIFGILQCISVEIKLRNR